MAERTKAQIDGDCTLPDTIRFLELFGWRFGLELDGELIIEPPPKSISNERLVDVLGQCRKKVIAIVKARADRERRQLIGGPFNGERHDKNWWCCDRGVFRQVKRGEWAIYRLEKDGRAFYVGKATSYKKARAVIYGEPVKREDRDDDEEYDE